MKYPIKKKYWIDQSYRHRKDTCVSLKWQMGKKSFYSKEDYQEGVIFSLTELSFLSQKDPTLFYKATIVISDRDYEERLEEIAYQKTNEIIPFDKDKLVQSVPLYNKQGHIYAYSVVSINEDYFMKFDEILEGLKLNPPEGFVKEEKIEINTKVKEGIQLKMVVDEPYLNETVVLKHLKAFLEKEESFKKIAGTPFDSHWADKFKAQQSPF